LCDTEADPNNCNLLSDACTGVNGTGTCPNKDPMMATYKTDFRNFMSYYTTACRNHFSAGQQAIMNSNLNFRITQLGLNIACSSPTISSYGQITGACTYGSPPSGYERNYELNNVSIKYSTASTPSICQSPFNVSGTGCFFYSCELPANQNVTIRPSKVDDYLLGVTAFDLSIIQQHILDIAPLSDPYHILAADVDNTGEIDGADMLFMRRLILRSATTFPNGVGSWRFIPERYFTSSTFSSVFFTNPFNASWTEAGQTRQYLANGGSSYMDNITLDFSLPNTTSLSSWSFHPIKMGDINCSAAPPTTALRMAPNTLSNLDNKAVSVKSGKEVTVLIKTKYAGKISAFQTGFNFTNSAIQIMSIEKGDFNSSNDVMDYIKLDKGEIRALWYNEKAKAKNFAGGVTIMKMKVKL
jgi:hypothetical protein